MWPSGEPARQRDNSPSHCIDGDRTKGIKDLCHLYQTGAEAPWALALAAMWSGFRSCLCLCHSLVAHFNDFDHMTTCAPQSSWPSSHKSSAQGLAHRTQPFIFSFLSLLLAINLSPTPSFLHFSRDTLDWDGGKKMVCLGIPFLLKIYVQENLHKSYVYSLTHLKSATDLCNQYLSEEIGYYFLVLMD